MFSGTICFVSLLSPFLLLTRSIEEVYNRHLVIGHLLCSIIKDKKKAPNFWRELPRELLIYFVLIYQLIGI